MIDEPRFWSHVALEDDSRNACWIWVGAMRDDGRGRYWHHGRDIRAHWAAWEIRHGEPVPANSRLEQECKQPNCVRHWRLVGPNRKLTQRAIREIATSLLSLRVLARRYGIAFQVIGYHKKRARTVRTLQYSQGASRF